MDTASAAKKAFIRQHDANPAITAILVGVLRDPEADLCTDGGFVLETSLDVESKQVQEWDTDRAYSTLDKILEGYGHAVPMEGTLWRVEYRGESQEPVARLLAVIVQE